MDSINKSLSDTNLDMVTEVDLDFTPPNFVGARTKRKRSSGHYSTDLESFQEEMRNMMKSLNEKMDKISGSLTHTINEMKQSMLNIESSVSFVSVQNENLERKLESLESERKKDHEYIIFLENQLEDLQRSNRKTSIEIRNVPTKQNETKEDLISMVTTLSESVNCSPINNKDIKDIFRIKKSKEKDNKTIVLELTSVLTKTDLLKACKTYNLKNKTSKLSLKHLGIKKNGDSPIFISEQLTAKAARLYFLARELTKSKLYKYCWTAFGKVYLRKDDASPIIIVNSEVQVQNLSKPTQ